MKLFAFNVGLACALAFISNAKAEAVKITDLDVFANSTSSTGYVVGSSTEDGIPRLRRPDGVTSRVGTYSYSASRVNKSGDVVGFADTGYEKKENDFAFFTRLGKESTLLLSEPDILGVDMNDAGQIAVLTKRAVHIFSGATEVATASASEIQSFQNILSVLPDGRALVVMTDAGSTRFGVVSVTGVLTVIPESMIPADSTFLLAKSNNKILFSRQKAFFESDLSSATSPVQNPAPTGYLPYAYSDDGGLVVWPDSDQTDKHFVLADGTLSPDIRCLIPSSKHGGASSIDVLSLVNRKSAVIKIGYSKYALLEITDGDLPNYCTDVKLTVGPECKDKFESNAQGGLYLKGAFTKRTKCLITATVKTGEKRPVRGATILTGSTLKRGKTNGKGKLTFPLHFDSASFYIELKARPAGSKDQDDSVVISSYR